MMRLGRREADALLAEKVMGWHLYSFTEKYGCWCDCIKGNHIGGSSGWADRTLDDAQYYIGPEWNPTTDPAASKMLRGKLAEAWNYDLGRFGSMPASFQFSLTRIGYGGIAITDADTEELAVALCALKSVGIDAEIVDE